MRKEALTFNITFIKTTHALNEQASRPLTAEHVLFRRLCSFCQFRARFPVKLILIVKDVIIFSSCYQKNFPHTVRSYLAHGAVMNPFVCTVSKGYNRSTTSNRSVTFSRDKGRDTDMSSSYNTGCEVHGGAGFLALCEAPRGDVPGVIILSAR